MVDLSHDLRFSPSSLVLTDTRLLALDGTTSAPAAQSWPLRPDLQLRMSDHAGCGHPGACTTASNAWPCGVLPCNTKPRRCGYNCALPPCARPWAPTKCTRCEPPTPTPCCPDCGQTLPPDSDECPARARQPQEKSSTWVLLRVGRFAKLP